MCNVKAKRQFLAASVLAALLKSQRLYRSELLCMTQLHKTLNKISTKNFSLFVLCVIPRHCLVGIYNAPIFKKKTYKKSQRWFYSTKFRQQSINKAWIFIDRWNVKEFFYGKKDPHSRWVLSHSGFGLSRDKVCISPAGLGLTAVRLWLEKKLRKHPD